MPGFVDEGDFLCVRSACEVGCYINNSKFWRSGDRGARFKFGKYGNKKSENFQDSKLWREEE